jgi:hypothetical protein
MPSSSSKNSLWLLPWLALLLFLCVICVALGSAPGVLTYLMDNRPFGSFTATQTPPVNGQPTPLPRITYAPSPSTNLSNNSSVPYGTYVDDFSNPSTGWIVTENEAYSIAYTKQQDYLLKIMSPDQYIFMTPPATTISPPYKNLTIQVDIKQENFPESSVGVMCRFEDSSNYYAVEIKGRKYKILRMVLGRETVLTAPGWKTADHIEYVDSGGYAHLTFDCTGSALTVTFNGQSQPAITDSAATLQDGNVAIFARSGHSAKPDLYDQVSFDNFRLTINP